MNIVDRAKNILITPKTEWDVVATDATPTQKLIVGYVLPLAAIAAVAAFIGQVFVGMSVPFMGTVRVPILAGVTGLVFSVVMAVVMVFVLGFIVDALAPTFGATRNMNQAVKVAAYSYTPVWIVGILAIVPALGLLAVLAGLYAIYLMYLGLAKVMRAPKEKAGGYTAVVVIAAIVVSVVIGTIGALITAPSMRAAGQASVTYDKDSAMGKLDNLARKMEQQGRKMDEAQKSGDTSKQMEAALGALGTAMSGGTAVEPVQPDALKPFVPEKFADLPRVDMRSKRGGVSGLMVTKAEGDYRDGKKQVQLEVSDTGGAAALLGMLTWMGVQGEKEDANRRESTRREGNRVVHEEVDKRGGNNQYTVLLNNRFVVSAEGNADFATLKSAVNGLELAKLEALK